MADLTARDIMTPDPITVAPDTKVTEAAKIMTERTSALCRWSKAAGSSGLSPRAI